MFVAVAAAAAGCIGAAQLLRPRAAAIALPYELPPDVRAHWRFPIPAQGEPPASYSELERSLLPTACGACHPAQLAQWQGSRHARATGPGVHAQMLAMGRTDPAGIRGCSRCHFPMTEQHRSLGENGAPNPLYDEALYQAGLSCAACHVRGHVRYGPARRTPASADAPHGGFVEAPLFSTSDFCARCHQFPADWPALNGKLLENTYVEWRDSKYAAEGVSCQGCHMPDRQHLFRGIHDPATTRSGVTITLDSQAWADGTGPARLAISNTGVGHMFPTYVTPAVVVSFVQLDETGAAIDGAARTHRVGRHLPITLDRELEDTRIAPGATSRFDYRVRQARKAVRLRVRVEVDPDEFYRRFYEARLRNDNPADVQAMYAQAVAESLENKYVLWQQYVELAP